jgi:hypothetical protein
MWRKIEVDINPPSNVLCSSALSSFFGAFVSRHRTHFPSSDNLLPRFSTFIRVALGLGIAFKLLDPDVVCVYGRRRGMMHG